MANSAARIAFSWLSLAAGISSAHPASAEPFTPVAASPHRIVVAAERAGSGTIGISYDGLYQEDGAYLGGAVGYLYRALPWLELGGQASYGHIDCDVSDESFVGAQVRGGLALDSARRFELGLSLSAGLVALLMTDVRDEEGGGVRSHYFIGPAGSVSPDFRFWVSPSWGLTLDANLALGKVQDVVDTPGAYFEDDDVSYVHAGAKLGVVAAL